MLYDLSFHYDLNSGNPKHIHLLENLLAFYSEGKLHQTQWNSNWFNFLRSEEVASWDLSKVFSWYITDTNELFIIIEPNTNEETIELLKTIFIEDFGGECLICRLNEDELYK